MVLQEVRHCFNFIRPTTPPGRVQSIPLNVRICQEPYVQISLNFLCMLPVAWSSGSIMISCVLLPVLRTGRYYVFRSSPES